MKILVIGDVTGIGVVKHLEAELWRYRTREKIDLVIVNAENAGFITGPSPDTAARILDAGADCLTGGNHTLRNKAIYSYLDEESRMLRPLNFGAEAPGSGYTVIDVSGFRIMVMSAMGNVHIEPNLDSPYAYIDRALSECCGKYDFSILDIHAEATGEKLALGYAYDGKINIIFGTHTHVPTADEQILPSGTGYITDVGMCGNSGGVLGMEPLGVIERMRLHMPKKFLPAVGACVANGVIFTLDTKSGRVTEVKRINF